MRVVQAGGPGQPEEYATICYSATPLGAPGGVTGGVIRVGVAVYPYHVAVHAGAACDPDTGVNFSPGCNTGLNGASVGHVDPRPGWTFTVDNNEGPCLWVLGTQYLTSCASRTNLTYQNGDLPNPKTVPTSQCLVSLISPCDVWMTGVKVEIGYDPGDTLTITTPLGTPPPVDLPKHCVGILAGCP